MRQTNACIFPVQRPGLATPAVNPADAAQLLRVFAQPVLVAALLLVLGWGLVWASQEAARVVSSAVAPAMSASIERRSLISEQDLQSQVDEYLAALGATNEQNSP